MLQNLPRTVMLLAAAAGLACSDSVAPEQTPGPPARVERIVDPTTATAGDVLNPAVRVTDSEGNPVPGVYIRWIAADGSGVVLTNAQFTDYNGVAVAEWWLGQDAKIYTMSAHVMVGTRADGRTVAVTTFRVTASARQGTA